MVWDTDGVGASRGGGGCSCKAELDDLRSSVKARRPLGCSAPPVVEADRGSLHAVLPCAAAAGHERRA